MDRWRHIPEDWPPKKTTVEIQVKSPQGSMIRYYVMYAQRHPCMWVTTNGMKLGDDQVMGWRKPE